MKFTTQKYSKTAAATNTGLLILSIMGLFFPVVLIATNDDSATNDTGELKLSRLTALCLLVVYGMLVVYQLKTHRHLFEESEEEDDDEGPPILGFYGSIFWCLVITLLIAVLSEFIVNAIQGAAASMNIPILFISTILLPIVGNAAEHASAVIFAMKNKMDISLGIAVGSATQIALFVIPFSVVVAWMIGQPLSLNFRPFETICLFLTVTMVSAGLNTGTSDWLKGCLLLCAYVLVSASFWIHSTPSDLSAENGT